MTTLRLKTVTATISETARFYKMPRVFPFWALLAAGQLLSAPARAAEPAPAPAGAEAGGLPAVLFFGDSLTAGYVVGQEAAFPAVIARKIKERGGAYDVVNAGISGETTGAGLRRLDWVLKRQPAVFVLSLGANDGLRGLPISRMEENLIALIRRCRKRFPDTRILLTGMKVPPNMGNPYAKRFEAVFPRIAETEDVALVPFLLEGVAGKPKFTLADTIHPNAEGHQIIAENVWPVLEPLLEEVVPGGPHAPGR